MVLYVTCSGLSGFGVEVARKIPTNPGPVRLAMSVRPTPLSSRTAGISRDCVRHMTCSASRRRPMICSSEKRFFTSNLLVVEDWTPNRRATQSRGDVSQPDVVILAVDVDVARRAATWVDFVFVGFPVIYRCPLGLNSGGASRRAPAERKSGSGSADTIRPMAPHWGAIERRSGRARRTEPCP